VRDQQRVTGAPGQPGRVREGALAGERTVVADQHGPVDFPGRGIAAQCPYHGSVRVTGV